MLYKFKSKTTGDVIMLEPNGRQILTLIGKGDAPHLVKGILEPADMPAAVAALQHAIAQEAENRKSTQSSTEKSSEGIEPPTAISLSQRAAPLLGMIARCHAANTPIVWGV